MKNITFRADENLIERARMVARAQSKTLNTAFREWLVQFTAQAREGHELDGLMRRMRHINAGRRFSRDQMEERQVPPR